MDRLIKKINTSPLIRRRVISGDTAHSFNKTFGVPLKTLIDRDEFVKVPRVLTSICEFLLLNGLETEGIFRVNGNTKAVESIKLLFQENYSVNMSSYTDVYAVASVLKQFLRELPNGVVSERIAAQFAEAYKNNVQNWEKNVDDFRSILLTLKEENYNLLKYLCQFLAKVAEKESINKMNPINLGIVFGPNVFQSSSNMEGLKMQTYFNNVMTTLVAHHEQFFGSISSMPQMETTLCLDNTIVPQIQNSDAHKSSPSLSGDFDLSSSNDVQLLPAPLPTCISSSLNRAIVNCVNNHLSMALSGEDFNQYGSKMDEDSDAHISRTSSVPHSIYKYSCDLSSGNNDSNEASLRSDLEPTAPPRPSVITTNGKSTPKKIHKGTTRRPLLATQGSWNETIDLQDAPNIEQVDNKSSNSALMDEIMHDLEDQNNIIDLDDFEGEDCIMNDMKENSLKNTKIPMIYEHSKSIKREYNLDRISTNDIQERHRFLRHKLKEFEENFECLHGCRPPNIEKTGNSQVQEWLTELMYLREQLHLREQENNCENLVSGDAHRNRTSHRISIHEANNGKVTSNIQSGTSTLSGISDQVGHRMKAMSSVDSLNSQNVPVVQFLAHLNAALEKQRRNVSRPESLSDMTKIQLDEEKVDLQKCLLHFEKNYGRPKEHEIKQLMKPLYDRYRLVKRCIKDPCDIDSKPLSNLTASHVNGECGHSSTSLSSRHRGPSKPSEEDIEYDGNAYKIDNPFVGCSINQTMSHSFTTSSDDRTNYRKPSTGSLKSNGAQEHISRIPTSPNTSKTSISSEGRGIKTNCPGNIKMRCQQTPNSICGQSAPLHDTPVHSVYSNKSFNSSENEMKPFRSCNTMSKLEVQTERDELLIEKRVLQKLLKDFEHGLEKMTSRKVDKSDRDHMRAEYDRYKTIKCRLRTLEKELGC